MTTSRPDRARLLDAYTRMVQIRTFEGAAGKNFADGLVPWFVPRCAGEEPVAVGLPGHGGSIKTAAKTTGYSVGGRSDAIAAALSDTKRKPSVIVGHSLGGALR